MSRRMTFLVALLALSLPAAAQVRSGVISGQVRDSAGVPQMGAVIKVFSGATQIATAFTDAIGRYAAQGLPAGTYQVRASAPTFLPSQRENLTLKAGAHLVVNLTLNTLFEAVQLLPPRKRNSEDDDDWKWTLRSAANRPILRALDPANTAPPIGSGQVAHDSSSLAVGLHADDRALRARVAFLAGSQAQGFGGAGDMTTAFRLESSLFSAGTVSLGGNVGYGAGSPAVLRAAYAHAFGTGSHPEVSFTLRRFATPDSVMHNAALQ